MALISMAHKHRKRPATDMPQNCSSSTFSYKYWHARQTMNEPISQAAVVLYFVFFANSGFSFFQVCPPPNEHNSTCCEFLRGIFDTVLIYPKCRYWVP